MIHQPHRAFLSVSGAAPSLGWRHLQTPPRQWPQVCLLLLLQASSSSSHIPGHSKRSWFPWVLSPLVTWLLLAEVMVLFCFCHLLAVILWFWNWSCLWGRFRVLESSGTSEVMIVCVYTVSGGLTIFSLPPPSLTFLAHSCLSGEEAFPCGPGGGASSAGPQASCRGAGLHATFQSPEDAAGARALPTFSVMSQDLATSVLLVISLSTYLLSAPLAHWGVLCDPQSPVGVRKC